MSISSVWNAKIGGARATQCYSTRSISVRDVCVSDRMTEKECVRVCERERERDRTPEGIIRQLLCF